MNILQLTKQLIKIPSYVNDTCDEKKVGDFIYDYLKINTSLTVIKQKVQGKRNNIIAYSAPCVKGNTLNIETMFIDHIDTVEPKNGWKFDQFKGKEIGGKLYGLGTYDTKGNVAVLMKLAEKIKNQKVMFLFYCDEEYDFKGMKTFISEYKKRLKVKRIISTDGSSMQIRSGCRGLIEIDIEVYGKTGHAANPKNGNNAIFSFNNILNDLNNKLRTRSQKGLGYPTLNISYIKGGLVKNKKDNDVTLGKNGNNIADYVESAIELRTNEKTSFSWVKQTLLQKAKSEGVKFVIKNVRHNLNPWNTDKKNVSFLTELMKKNNQIASYTDAGTTGYVDIAMLAEAFKTICCTIGAKGANGHAVNEYVEVKSLETLYQILFECV